ncbi:MAG: hypothetical protein ABSC06_18210 [Rhodopila sp.]|jgi:hypothetical protein
MSERTWRDRHRESRLAGLDDRRLAPSIRRAPMIEIERMLLDRGFTLKRFQEQPGEWHNDTVPGSPAAETRRS